MSHRFASALLNRNRDRQLLAEALHSKYEAERRRTSFVRLLAVFALAGAAYYAYRGAGVSPFTLKPPHGLFRPTILAEMKQQLDGGEPIVIGAQAAAPPPRSSAGADSKPYAEEKIPLNLYAELRRPKKPPAPSQSYLPPSPRRQLEWNELKARRGHREQFVCARYQPARPEDLRKLAPLRRRPPAPPTASLYAQVSSPPSALMQDEYSFPRKR